jgi:hypothetical protein
MDHSEIVKTETVVKKTVRTAINVNGPLRTFFSIDTHGSANPGTIDLVIGANFKNRAASALDKASLKKLIDTLVDIHDAMV